MSEEDKEKVRALLNDEDYQIKKAPGQHTSIGIRNVNRRIRLVYGDEYGLTIEQNEDLVTTSKITLPYQKKEKEKSIRERNAVERELIEVTKRSGRKSE